jgi:hypothetical protein
MPFKYFCLLASMYYLAACAQEEKTVVAGVEADNNVATAGNIVINVELAPALEKRISVASAVGARPGKKNPVETSITLKNESANSLALEIKGDWYDARGNHYGGSRSTLTIAGRQTHALHAGTRSADVSGYKLFVTDEIQSADDRFANTLSDPAIQVAEGYGMTYSESASDEQIPALPVRGFANGSAFAARAMAFYQGLEGKWRLEISDHDYDVLKGVAAGRLERKDMQTIYINFDTEPEAGHVLEQKMAYGGGIFQIKKSDGSLDTTSWNTSLAYAIHVDSWEKESRGQPPCGKRDLGSASGKLYISFQGSEFSFENSWVSGEFKDIPIVYCNVD